MPDSDRPAGDAPSRVIPLSAGRRGGRFAPLSSATDVARRLAALERQVEDALADAGRASGADTMLRAAADEVLARYGDVRRWVMGESPVNPLAEMSRQAFYRFWWRVDAVGLERVPRIGRVLVVANRAGTLLPYEAFMLAEALEGTVRAARPLIDPSLIDIPIVGSALAGLGAMPSTPTNVRQVLQSDELAVVFPEGPGAVAKPYAQRYRLAAFGRSPLLRAAVETGTPIVPVAVIGSEEVHPVLYRAEALGKPLGLAAVPITPTLLPLPTKWTLHVGEPLDVAARWAPAAAKDAKVLRALREQVRERLQGLVSDGVRRRRGLFR